MEPFREIVLTPEEIYYIGKKTGGKYIDYAYIAAMRDIGERKKLRMQEILDGLVKKGLAEEDFFGEAELDGAAAAFVSPIYNSSYESELQILENGAVVFHYKFHLTDGDGVSVKCGDGEYRVRRTNPAAIRKLFIDAAGMKSDAADAPDQIPFAAAKRIFVVKGTEIGESESMNLYGISDGTAYEPDPGMAENHLLKRMSWDDFTNQAIQVLSGG